MHYKKRINKLRTTMKRYQKYISIITLLMAAPAAVLASAPANPPLNNASAPLNVSDTGQSKTGNLFVGTSNLGYATGFAVGFGNVGIGTLTPAYKLDVSGSAKVNSLTISGVSGATQCLTVNSSGVVSGTGVPCGSGSGGITSFTINTPGGSGLSGGGTINSSGGTLNLTNSGVTSISGGSNISVSGSTGAVTISATGLQAPLTGSCYGQVIVAINSSGGVTCEPDDTGSGTPGFGAVLGVSGDGLGRGFINVGNSSFAGSVSANGFFYTSSDERLKTNIQTIPDALNKVLNLRGVEYNLKSTNEDSIGVIAQEVEKVFPQVVSTGPDGYKKVAYGNLIGSLIEAIKAQQKEIDELKAEVSALKK
jgi:hypothetical protein